MKQKSLFEKENQTVFSCDCGFESDCWWCYEEHIWNKHHRVPMYTEQFKYRDFRCKKHKHTIDYK